LATVLKMTPHSCRCWGLLCRRPVLRDYEDNPGRLVIDTGMMQSCGPSSCRNVQSQTAATRVLKLGMRLAIRSASHNLDRAVEVIA
jgi:hypothetical protein